MVPTNSVLKTSNKHRAVIIFTRFPIPGQAKTRLIPHLGAEKAAQLQRLMTEFTVGQAHRLVEIHGGTIEIHHEGGTKKLLENWIQIDGLAFYEQQGGDLGAKLRHAVSTGFKTGYQKIIITGTDCPSLTCSIFEKAFQVLENHDLVLGPAKDGGFYLIGLKEEKNNLFNNVVWGTEDVLKTVLANAEKENLSVFLLSILSDIDRPEDLISLEESDHILSRWQAMKQDLL